MSIADDVGKDDEQLADDGRLVMKPSHVLYDEKPVRNAIYFANFLRLLFTLDAR